jgi:hypothetical protein
MIRETNGPTFVRHGTSLLAAAIFLTLPTTALAQSATSVPEPERIAATHAFEPGAGMEWQLEPLMFRDSIAAIRRQSNFGSTLPQELVEFRPGANGEWAIAGTIDIPGLNLASVRAISANGFDTLAAAQTDGLVVVARKVGGSWETLPLLEVPVVFSASIVGGPGPITIVLERAFSWDVHRFEGGAWQLVRSLTIADFGFSERVGPVEVGDGFVVTSGVVAPGDAEATPGAVRTSMIDLRSGGAAAAVRLPVSAGSQLCGERIAAGGRWVAYTELRIGQGRHTNRLVEIGEGGTVTPVAQWQGADASDYATLITPAGDVARADRVRFRGTQGVDERWTWLAGTSWAISAFGTDRSIAVSASSSMLRIWPRPWDADGDGRRDAEQVSDGTAEDCNRNGATDAGDIVALRLADTDGNGLPDACEQDCDLDGIPDLTELRDGAAAVCGSTTVLASCAIAGGDTDLNGDGVPDQCGPDRDGNGIPDVLDIAAGAPDCNDDGIPNGAPVVGIAAEQLAEESEILGWLVGSSPRAWLAGAYFPIDRTMRIDAARFRINPGTDPTHPASPLGKPFTIVIAQDADGSADLRRAQVEWTGTGSYRHQSLQSLPTPSVVVEPPGFFVCYSIPPGTFNSSSGGTAAPTLRGARADFGANPAARIDRGWSAVGPQAGTDPRDLLSVAVAGTWFPDIDVVADGCPLGGDFDGDGKVSGRDLGLLLGAWGPAKGSPYDLNSDGSVDGLDLGILLGNFTAGA